MNGIVNALACWSGIIHAGGSFGTVGGVTRTHMAIMGATMVALTVFDPIANGAELGRRWKRDDNIKVCLLRVPFELG